MMFKNIKQSYNTTFTLKVNMFCYFANIYKPLQKYKLYLCMFLH